MFPLERARRIERPTLTLARLCSTPELRPQSKWEAGYDLSARRIQAGFDFDVNEASLTPRGGRPPLPYFNPGARWLLGGNHIGRQA